MNQWEQPVFIYPASALPITSEKIIIEIGPGRGDFLFHLAEKNPDTAVIGIEIKHRRVDKLIRRIETRKLNNVIVMQNDARKALAADFKDQTIDEIHIHFPDPWPKRRHEKNRAINREFLHECFSLLKKGGHIFFTTDYRLYAETVADMFSKIEGFKPCYQPAMAKESKDAFPTFFAQKWQAQGREITYQKYLRII